MTARWIAYSLVVLACIHSAALAQPADTPKLGLFGADDEPLIADPAQEQSIVKRLYAAADDPKSALTAMAELPKTATELELRALRNLDRELSGSGDKLHRELVRKGVVAMATSGDATSLQYLHKIFDSKPTRRAAIADAVAQFALEKQRRPHDWPLLVRSLTTVKGDQAVHVLQALLKYRERGTSPTVQRNVLLAGLELGDDRAAAALKLLSYWTGTRPADETAPVDQQLASWQQWYRERYPSLPAATLPTDDPRSSRKFAELVTFLRSDEARGNAAQGKLLFEQTLCIKCHQFGERGERIGPDLTKVSQHLSDEEQLQSLLFPSHQISDQYATKQITLESGKIVSGIVGESGDTLIVLPADAKKVVVPKKEIAGIAESPLSAMPTGLADKLTRQQIADLFAFLAKVPD